MLQSSSEALRLQKMLCLMEPSSEALLFVENALFGGIQFWSTTAAKNVLLIPCNFVAINKTKEWMP